MTIRDSLYGAVATAAAGALPLLGRGSGKLGATARGMTSAPAALEDWARRNRDLSRPLVWFHAPSVGEGLQARAVMSALRALRPEVQIVYTYLSPSAEAFAAAAPADFAGFLPADTPRNAARAFDFVVPSVLVFTKSEVWPGYVREAGRRGVPVALVSATLPPGSSRLRTPAPALLTPAHRRLALLAAIAPADAERYGALGVPAARREVMGDARFDQVARRAAAVDPSSPLLGALDRPGTAIVAGSTWPEDEMRLIDAFASCRGAGGEPFLVIAPHEPTGAALEALERLVARFGLDSVRLEAVLRGEGANRPVVLVDRVGVLGDIYAVAKIAYVGGGFGKAGLHSVLEPAAFGAPVLFGPRHQNAREAADLIAAGGAAETADADTLLRHLQIWLADDEARRTAGNAARQYVESGLGAAERGAHLILGLLDDQSRSPSA